LDKSEIPFIQNDIEEKQLLLQGWIQLKAVECHSKYLGSSAFVGKSKQQVSNFAQDMV